MTLPNIRYQQRRTVYCTPAAILHLTRLRQLASVYMADPSKRAGSQIAGVSFAPEARLGRAFRFPGWDEDN